MPFDINKPTTKITGVRTGIQADHWTLQSGAGAATDSGKWAQVALNKTASAELAGTVNAGSTVQIRGSNKPFPNDSTDDGFLIGTLTGASALNWSYPVRWVKAKVTVVNANDHFDVNYIGVA